MKHKGYLVCNSFQPRQGRLTLAQRFIAGVAPESEPSPGGTAETTSGAGKVQSSLRDANIYPGSFPSDQSLSYSQKSLRDNFSATKSCPSGQGFLVALATCLMLLIQGRAAHGFCQQHQPYMDSSGTQSVQSPMASKPEAHPGEQSREKPAGRKAPGASPERESEKQPASSQAGHEQDVPVDPHRDEGPKINIPPAPAGPSRYRFEFGVFPRYNSNLFQATGGAPRQATFITTLAAKFEADLVRGEASTLTSGFGFRRNLYSGVRHANSSDFDITLDYGFGRNKLQLTYFTTPRRLAYIAGDESIFNRLQGIDLKFSRRVTRRTRARVGYEFAREIFSTRKDRDSGRHELSADVKYRVHHLFTPGIGFELGWVKAQSTNFSRNEATLVFLLDSRIKDAAWMSLRYRYSQRDYITADPSAGNFGREDRRHDVRLYANIKLTKQWWLSFYNAYTTNASTRARRAFTGHEAGVGIVFRWP